MSIILVEPCQNEHCDLSPDGVFIELLVRLELRDGDNVVAIIPACGNCGHKLGHTIHRKDRDKD